MDRYEFISRFKSRLHDILGVHYDPNYVDQIAPTYWDDLGQRSEGPEECAEAEASEWGQE